MFWLTKSLNLLFGYRWSVHFCEGKNDVKYILHGDSAMQLLLHIACMWEEKELCEPWYIRLKFNKSGAARELRRQDFEEGSSISEELSHWIRSRDPKIGMRPGHMAFVKAGTRRELALGPRHTFARGLRSEADRSDLLLGLEKSSEGKPAAIQSLDDLEDTIFQRRI